MTLPNFLIIGAPKAGTTSLYDYLRAHPEIFMTRIKGTRFFCYKGAAKSFDYPVTTLEEYEAQFAEVRGEKAIGEATALYFEFPDAARRISETLPEAKFIACLREPVQRAFSIYHMNLRDRGTNAGKSFLQALETDPALRKMYYDGLKPFYDRFNRSQMKIILFEDLAGDTAGTVLGLFEFLGVDPNFVPPLKISNPGGAPRLQAVHNLLVNKRLRAFGRHYLPESLVRAAKDLRSTNFKKHAMTPAERAGARRFFDEDIRRTQDLVGIDLSHWLTHASMPAAYASA